MATRMRRRSLRFLPQTSPCCARIKTIGDAYLAVSGMPDPDPNHAENVLRAALEARNYLAERNRSDGLRWEMRFGIHSGTFPFQMSP